MSSEVDKYNLENIEHLIELGKQILAQDKMKARINQDVNHNSTIKRRRKSSSNNVNKAPPKPDFNRMAEEGRKILETMINEDKTKHDLTSALELVSKLENSTVTKEILEATRLGGLINDIRRRTAESAPELSKRCRILIKNWQKLIDYARPPSTCGSSSTSTTPNLVSPAVRSRGLTPRTPKTPAKVTPSIGGLKTGMLLMLVHENKLFQTRIFHPVMLPRKSHLLLVSQQRIFTKVNQLVQI